MPELVTKIVSGYDPENPGRSELWQNMPWVPVPVLVQKLRPDATVPTKNNQTDLGWDVYCVADDEGWVNDELAGTTYFILQPGESKIFKTGIAMKPDHDEWGFLLRDRSGMGAIRNITVLAGVIDHGYTGEWKVCLVNLSNQVQTIHEGDKIVQAVMVPRVPATLIEVESMEETERGDKGFGSSGR